MYVYTHTHTRTHMDTLLKIYTNTTYHVDIAAICILLNE